MGRRRQVGWTRSRSLRSGCGHGHCTIGHVVMKLSRWMEKSSSVLSDCRRRRRGLKLRTNK